MTIDAFGGLILDQSDPAVVGVPVHEAGLVDDAALDGELAAVVVGAGQAVFDEGGDEFGVVGEEVGGVFPAFGGLEGFCLVVVGQGAGQEAFGVDEVPELLGEFGGEGGVFDQDAGLDVFGLAEVGEVGAGDQGEAVVDHDAFGVELDEAAGLGGALVVVEGGERFAEGPVVLQEGQGAVLGVAERVAADAVGLAHVEAERDAYAALAHGGVQGLEDVAALGEVAAAEDDGFFGGGQELAHDCGGVADHALLQVGAGPDQVEFGGHVLFALGDGDLQGDEGTFAAQAADGSEAGPEGGEAAAEQLEFGQGAVHVAAFNDGLQAGQLGEREAGQAGGSLGDLGRVHGRLGKKASWGSWPRTGTTRARSR